jgi:nitrous oxidase accessory protein NosD
LAGWFIVVICLYTQAISAAGARPSAPGVGGVQAAGGLDWHSNLRKVHARFTGQKGTFAQFGDSITDTMAFWTPLQYVRKNASPEMEKAFVSVKAYLRPECWRDWKGPDYGSQGGQTTEWALKNIDGWLKRLNPEVALVLFGTNNLHSIEADEYSRNLRSIVRKCLDNGTAVILSTIPPRHGFEKKAAEFAEAARKVAQETGVPLTDFYAEILKRRPDDWDGALDKFNAYQDYDVPTLLARDGVHPSYPQKYQNDYSEEALRSCGYGLRNALTLLKYAEVIGVLKGQNPAGGAAIPTPQPQSSTADTRRAALQPPEQPWFPKAPRLPAPSGDILSVATVEELYAAAEHVRPGGTILVADGYYEMREPLEIKTDRVALRGASGRREKVILDGGNRGELVRITACSGVTVADLTVQNVQWNGIKINSETGVQKLTIYNCLLHNIWQRAVKGVKVPAKDRERIRPSGFRVQYCLFWNDHPKQFSDDSADTDQNFRGNYIGGIDVMYPRDWVISDNVFIGIHGRTDEARGAVFLWQDVQNCVVERNIIIDCDSGICLGNSFRPEDITIHCTGCIVRNNFITRAHENGILADYTKDCKILNNTIYDPESPLGRLIRVVHDNDGLLVANNLVCGPPIRIESQSRITLRNNLEKDLSAALSDPAHGDLRLTDRALEAINRAVSLPEVTEDIDRTPRGPRPAIGAYEFQRPKRTERHTQ